MYYMYYNYYISLYIQIEQYIVVYYSILYNIVVCFHNIETIDLKLTLVINLTLFGEPELSRTKMRLFFSKRIFLSTRSSTLIFNIEEIPKHHFSPTIRLDP